jgi:hypothetical protein
MSAQNSLKPLWDIIARPVTYPLEVARTNLPKNRKYDNQTKGLAVASSVGVTLAALALLNGAIPGAILLYAVTGAATYGRDPKVINKNNKKAEAKDPLKMALGDDFGQKLKESKEAGMLKKAFNFLSAPVSFVKNTYQMKKAGGSVDAVTKRADWATKLALTTTVLTAAFGAYPLAAVIYGMSALYTYDKQPQGHNKPAKSPFSDLGQFSLNGSQRPKL